MFLNRTMHIFFFLDKYCHHQGSNNASAVVGLESTK